MPIYLNKVEKKQSPTVLPSKGAAPVNKLDKNKEGKTCYIPICPHQDFHRGNVFKQNIVKLSEKLGPRGKLIFILTGSGLESKNYQYLENSPQEKAKNKGELDDKNWLENSSWLLEHQKPEYRVI
jgi:hypothetical protein